MAYGTPNGREEYPIHLNKTQSALEKNDDGSVRYYQCKVYDGQGNLLRIEMRPPIDFRSKTATLRSFDYYFTGYSGPDEGCEEQ